MNKYIFDNAAPQASQRFASLETLYDPWTIRHLEATGIGAGWQCWEVGAGGGSIAAWLAECCGPRATSWSPTLTRIFSWRTLRLPTLRLRSSARHR